MKLFEDLPEVIENTLASAQRCSFYLHKIKPFIPQLKTPEGKMQEETLHDKARDSLEERLELLKLRPDCEEIQPKYFESIEYELGIIEKMGFRGYFLIVADYVRWVKIAKYSFWFWMRLYRGFDSEWSIKIKDIEPIRSKLFFSASLILIFCIK